MAVNKQLGTQLPHCKSAGTTVVTPLPAGAKPTVNAIGGATPQRNQSHGKCGLPTCTVRECTVKLHTLNRVGAATMGAGVSTPIDPFDGHLFG